MYENPERKSHPNARGGIVFREQAMISSLGQGIETHRLLRAIIQVEAVLVPILSLQELHMSRIIRGALAAALLAALAACATAPQADPNFNAPPRKLDAKTQLESGRR
jgi:hypothetical protein